MKRYAFGSRAVNQPNTMFPDPTGDYIRHDDPDLAALVKAAGEAEYLFAHGVGAVSGDTLRQDHNVNEGKRIMENMVRALAAVAGPTWVSDE